MVEVVAVIRSVCGSVCGLKQFNQKIFMSFNFFSLFLSFQAVPSPARNKNRNKMNGFEE